MPLPELFAAFRWWIAIMILGMAATPLAFVLFQKLPDRGYAFVKMLGLLIGKLLFLDPGQSRLLGQQFGWYSTLLTLLLGLSILLYRAADVSSPRSNSSDPEVQLGLTQLA